MDDVGHRHARGRIFSAAGGLVALVALTAGAVVALGSSPDHTRAAPAPPATAATTQPAPAHSVTASATPAAPAEHHAAGTVRHGVHSGDLRFFLLPAPADADVYGDPAGSPLSVRSCRD
jgi:hypothetical protein